MLMKWISWEESNQYPVFRMVHLWNDVTTIAAGATLERLNDRSFRAEEKTVLIGAKMWIGVPSGSPYEITLSVTRFPLSQWGKAYRAESEEIFEFDIHKHAEGWFSNEKEVWLPKPLLMEKDETLIVHMKFLNASGSSINAGDYRVTFFIAQKE